MGKLQNGTFKLVLKRTCNIHTTELIHELLPQHTLTIRVIHEPYTTTTIHLHIDECAVEHQRSYTAARTNTPGVPTWYHNKRNIHKRFRKRSAHEKENEEKSTHTGRDI